MVAPDYRHLHYTVRPVHPSRYLYQTAHLSFPSSGRNYPALPRSLHNMTFESPFLSGSRLPVAFYFYMDAVLHKFAEKITLHIRFFNAAGKINGKSIFKAGNGTVSTPSQPLSIPNSPFIFPFFWTELQSAFTCI